ncbi:hypothetical protein DIPPA_21622 [Diplonema papillatum]|nr:hypothetical protein DIPPA_21622 [Diplonema papillatum]KAJ9472805.1 hypothetical protein DIPPA_21622 [Diplonema papillatum]
MQLAWHALTVALLSAAAAAQDPGYVLIFSPPASKRCANCTCVDCPCVREIPECRKCQGDDLVARFEVHSADGACHDTFLTSPNPFVDKDSWMPLMFMAVACRDGLWLAADGPTKDECETRAEGLVRDFESGEFDARTGVCLTGGKGSFLRFHCHDDSYTETPVPDPFRAYVSEHYDGNSLQAVVSDVSDAVPVVVPPMLLVLYIVRHSLPALRGSTTKTTVLVGMLSSFAILLLFFGGSR